MKVNHRTKDGFLKASYGLGILERMEGNLDKVGDSFQVRDDWAMVLPGQMKLFFWKGDTLKIVEGTV